MIGNEIRITRKDINSQIRERLAELGIAATFGMVPCGSHGTDSRLMWTIGGEQLTTGQAADKYLPGGFAGNFGKA